VILVKVLSLWDQWKERPVGRDEVLKDIKMDISNVCWEVLDVISWYYI